MSHLDDWLKPGEAWTDITADPDELRERAQAAAEYRQYIEDVRTVARTAAGARFICGLLDRLGAFDPSWSEKNARLAKTVVLRDFGQEILDDLAVAADDVHDDISRMMRIRRKATLAHSAPKTEE